jgi:hypothetical protein
LFVLFFWTLLKLHRGFRYSCCFLKALIVFSSLAFNANTHTHTHTIWCLNYYFTPFFSYFTPLLCANTLRPIKTTIVTTFPAFKSQIGAVCGRDVIISNSAPTNTQTKAVLFIESKGRALLAVFAEINRQTTLAALCFVSFFTALWAALQNTRTHAYLHVFICRCESVVSLIYCCCLFLLVLLHRCGRALLCRCFPTGTHATVQTVPLLLLLQDLSQSASLKHFAALHSLRAFSFLLFLVSCAQ